ncbi:hypothetical protein [Fodinibius sediminis]|uniref:MetA-pathway of phenol degradation n=1 Tax=Fodinibius sediminis TaxID=1214077 RepID=A0A521D3G3_9BACT|nr:hypothetical protein [Fodinibius sediminis]SMO65460.1 hypothetical protein SAMN06265218_10893 [Fodinibius sediminis]
MKCIIQKHQDSYRKFFFLSISAFLLYAWPADLKSQAVLGAREMAMGQATTALPNSSWSIFSNPAMMPGNQSSVSFFGVRYYGLSEITDIAAAAIYATSVGVIGAGVHRYGYNLFNESRLRLGYKNAAAGFHYGLVMNYSHVAQGGEYGSAGALGVDLGVAAPILPELWIAAKAVNINQPVYGSRNGEELPRNLSLGFSYYLTDIALFSGEVFKDVRFPIAYRGGIEVQIVGGLTGRAGMTTSPQTFTAGFGYAGSLWRTSVAVQRHENSILGYSPAVDFSINW